MRHYTCELSHHGIQGQKWGVRNGPPYPLGGDTYRSAAEKKYTHGLGANSTFNKRHFDKTIKKGTTLSTLSYDKNRTKNADMFYATFKKLDKAQYMAMFNSPIPQAVYDQKGLKIGVDKCYKFSINNEAIKDIKVASEDSATTSFMKLYSQDRDFCNFVKDPKRMASCFTEEKYKFKGYRDARASLKKLNTPGYVPTSKDLKRSYRIFNYVIPFSDVGNEKLTTDVVRQRTKFFNELKKRGYGAVLDTNDAIYGGYKANSPVIVFDMSGVALKYARRTSIKDKEFATAATVGRKVIMNAI